MRINQNLTNSKNKEKIQLEIFGDYSYNHQNRYSIKNVKQLNTINFEKELNEQQLEIVNEIKGPQLVIAGAGSGKTRTIVYAVAKLITSHINPSQIMLVTFTNKAAKEMMNRVEKLLGIKPIGIWAGTFHSIANRFLRKYAKSLGLEPNYSIIDEIDANLLMKIAYNAIDYQNEDISLPSPKIAKKILSYSINCNRSIEKTIKWKYPQYNSEKIISKLNQIFDLYKTKKAKDNLVDFDDLLLFWSRLLDERSVARAIASNFKYILVDEYQDTNFIQDEIINKISKDSPDCNILAVGDDAQSIYGFRGANFQNIMQFARKHNNCRIFKLTYNYRSVPEILNLANESIRHNMTQFEKQMKTTKPSGLIPFHIISENDEEQAKYIVNKIIELQEKNEKLENIAILYRAGFHSLQIELELKKNNLPYVVHSGVSFFEKSHVKDLIAHLRIVQNAYDEVSWLRILTLFDGIGKKKASQLVNTISRLKDPLNEILQNDLFLNQMVILRISKKIRQEIIQFLKNFIQSLQKLNTKEILMQLIDILIPNLKKRYSNWQDRLEDLNQLIIYSQNYESISSFLDILTLNKTNIETRKFDLGTNINSDSMLTLSTIHRAKGLEWNVVFIPMLSENLFPTFKVKDDIESFEEERRVFYVGITRAKDQLYLISPTKVKNLKGQINLNTSQFINELNPKVYQVIQSKSNNVPLFYNKNKREEKLKESKNKHFPLFTSADSLLKK
ncbi:MAG: ATP-dependent helicase [Candidatus Lokiarchaeota archaeon]|nr:ATP-dependent helicase [Candidatus Lokiarchaeota archaeon]